MTPMTTLAIMIILGIGAAIGAAIAIVMHCMRRRWLRSGHLDLIELYRAVGRREGGQRPLDAAQINECCRAMMDELACRKQRDPGFWHRFEAAVDARPRRPRATWSEQSP